jgi:hypothetical protein
VSREDLKDNIKKIINNINLKKTISPDLIPGDAFDKQ